MTKFKKVLLWLLSIVLIIAAIFCFFKLQKRVKVKMYDDDKVSLNLPKEYELVQPENVLLQSYPALLTFKHGRYTIDVVEFFDGYASSFAENQNLIIAQSEVVNSILTMANSPDDDTRKLALENADAFKKQYENIYPVPEHYDAPTGYHRNVSYTDLSYFDGRIQPMFQGVIIDVIELSNSYLGVFIYDDYYDEDVKLNECKFQALLDMHPQSYFEDMSDYIMSMSDSTISTYNACAARSELLRKRMEDELNYFESRISINSPFYHLLGTTLEQDGKTILQDKLNYDSSENMKFYTDDIQQEVEIEE